MSKIIPLILILIYCSTSDAIVIRHDKSDDLYKYRTSATPALVTFTTPHKGDRYVVGSGTYIGNGWVITAAHVANFFEDADNAKINGEYLSILDVTLHEKWRDRQVEYDIALVKVSMPTKAVAPVSLFDYDLEVNETVIIAGRGDTGNGLVGMMPSDLEVRVAENKVEQVKGQWISFTFNAPEQGALEYEGMCGGGDSGSPAYTIKDGTTHLLGLSSWQDTEATNWKQGFYGVSDYYSNISFYKQWLLKNLPQTDFLKKHPLLKSSLTEK
jgi:hypothetical protein